ncbi:MAG: efflux RND transporter periplasmic adaptor subunit [Rhodospirillales bacterium]|nr:efflux RND transporter periplasmic adaptor subunit [Rhodospirillales bacterium]
MATKPSPVGFGTMAALVLSALAASLTTACEQQPQQQANAAPPPAVTVAKVGYEEITSATGFVGRIEAVDKVELRARVVGFLEKQLFEEGGHVNKGDLLFQIQQSEFQATADESKAEVASAEANKANTAAQLKRYEILFQKKDVSAADVDRLRAEDLTAGANILKAKAALEKAELDLAYTEIRAPISGRIGRATFTVGNLVGPESGVLATIVSQDPIYVTFPVSQRILLDVQKQAQSKDKSTKDNVIVRLTLADGSAYPHQGKIDFADIQISQSTDTLAVRGSLPNPDGLLVDGQFATVSVEGDAPKKALVVPRVALQADQAGAFVLVVSGENKAEIRRIKMGDSQEGNIVVENGLKEGERVIVEGAQKVRPGQVVEASEMPAAKPGA